MSLSMFALTGKVAVVTGSGRGIGRAIALGFAQVGADVVFVARTAADIESAAEEIRTLGRGALAIPTDVRDSEQVANMVQKTMAQFGRIDILVNNAGGSFVMPLLEMSGKAWNTVIRENLDSVFLCSKAVGAVMVNQGKGSIVNITSVVSYLASLHNAHYAAAKAAIVSLTQNSAVEWGPYGIRVNAIAPGYIHTQVADWPHMGGPEAVASRLKVIPLGRFGRPEDIVGGAIFLASDASGYITGVTVPVHGGLTAFVD